MSRLWVLTDSAALRERMPAALVDALEARGTAPRLVVADRAPASWRGLARGVRVVQVRRELGRLPWDGRPLLAQAYVATGGVDLHLCVAGDRVWARRRPSPLVAPRSAGRPVAVSPSLARLALGCARRFGLAL